jgi:hypothetical protein
MMTFDLVFGLTRKLTLFPPTITLLSVLGIAIFIKHPNNTIDNMIDKIIRMITPFSRNMVLRLTSRQHEVGKRKRSQFAEARRERLPKTAAQGRASHRSASVGRSTACGRCYTPLAHQYGKNAEAKDGEG